MGDVQTEQDGILRAVADHFSLEANRSLGGLRLLPPDVDSTGVVLTVQSGDRGAYPGAVNLGTVIVRRVDCPEDGSLYRVFTNHIRHSVAAAPLGRPFEIAAASTNAQSLITQVKHMAPVAATGFDMNAFVL